MSPSWFLFPAKLWVVSHEAWNPLWERVEAAFASSPHFYLHCNTYCSASQVHFFSHQHGARYNVTFLHWNVDQQLDILELAEFNFHNLLNAEQWPHILFSSVFTLEKEIVNCHIISESRERFWDILLICNLFLCPDNIIIYFCFWFLLSSLLSRFLDTGL